MFGFIISCVSFIGPSSTRNSAGLFAKNLLSQANVVNGGFGSLVIL